MNSLATKYMKGLKITHELIRMIGRLREYKGQQSLYRKQAPEVLENLRLVSLVQSTESSSRLEQVTAPQDRFRQLMAEKVKPQNRSEAEIAGYRDVLSTIHQSANEIPLSVSVIKQFHRDLMRYTDRPGGTWKNTNNPIVDKHPDGSERVRFEPVAPFKVDETMNHLVKRLILELSRGEYDPLILIPLFILDFTCIHPFTDGNGRTSRLLTTLLLYHQGYDVAKYISVEKIVEKTKESYYETLERSSLSWHEADHDAIPFVSYTLSTFLAAYDEFEKRANISVTARGAKTEMIINSVEGFKGNFSVSDIQEACPLVSIDLIRRTLKELRKNGVLVNISRGRYAKWRKV